MSKRGRPTGIKNDRGLHTVAIPKELYDQLHELSIGSSMSMTAVATLMITGGLASAHIVEETITRKRLVVD